MSGSALVFCDVVLERPSGAAISGYLLEVVSQFESPESLMGFFCLENDTIRVQRYIVTP
jgi:hypothetical protein